MNQRRLRSALAMFCVVFTAACGGRPSATEADVADILLSVQQTQTAAAAATNAAQPPATATLPAEQASATTAASATLEPSPTESASPTASATLPAGATSTSGAGPVAGPTSGTPGQPGTITGALSYPSEGIPRLKVYAWDRESGQWRFVITNESDNTYVLQAPPGRYIVFAYLNDGGPLAAGYTQAVLCGLTVACTDHMLIVVTVGSGQQVSGVNVTDWYGPPGFIPQPPG